MADRVKLVVSVLKNALDEIQSSNLIDEQPSSSANVPIVPSVPSTSTGFAEAARRDFRYSVFLYVLCVPLLATVQAVPLEVTLRLLCIFIQCKYTII